MAISRYEGTIGSGKSYHALEDIIAALEKGKHVIANFPINFSSKQIKSGMADRFMFLSDEQLRDTEGVIRLIRIGLEHFHGKEGSCLVVIDEAGNYFPPHLSTHPTQLLWNKFFTLSRKLGFDFILIMQGANQINRTIKACTEYYVSHRCANNIFPFSLLPFKIFMYVTYWAQQRQRLGSSSSILVKKFANLYDTHRIFSDLEKDANLDDGREIEEVKFGNCIPAG